MSMQRVSWIEGLVHHTSNAIVFQACHHGNSERFLFVVFRDDTIKYEEKSMPNELHHDGTTDLHAAIISGDLECVKKLSEQANRINETNIRGETPLFWAAQTKNKTIMKFIVQHP